MNRLMPHEPWQGSMSDGVCLACLRVTCVSSSKAEHKLSLRLSMGLDA